MVADQYGRAAHALFLAGEAAAESRGGSPHLEEARSSDGLGDLFRKFAGGERDILRIVAADRLKRGVEAVPVLEADRRYEGLGILAGEVPLMEGDKLVAVGKRQGPQNDSVNGREDGAVRADAQGEREDYGRRERRRTPNEAERRAQVCLHPVEEEGGMHIAELLPDLLPAAEVEDGPTTGLLGLQSFGQVCLNEDVEVVGDLPVEAFVVSGLLRASSEPGHVASYFAVCRMSETAPESRSQLSSSRTSCLRPFAERR